MSTLRPVRRVLQAQTQREGGGFIVRRPFPVGGLIQLDPFLLLDEMGPVDYAPGEAVGAPDHPHRGFETVTYFLEGGGEHEDSAGHKGQLRPGDVQWMTAGSGVIHSELPAKEVLERGGRMHGFQIWVNLPRRDKMIAPRYQEIPSRGIPERTSADGLARVRVIAGEALGARAVIETRTPILLHDWTLQPGASVDVPLPVDHDVFAYVFQGAIVAGAEKTPVAEGKAVVFGPGEAARLAVPAEAKCPARLLLLGGVPLHEPVARYGPFVMNTPEEIHQAIIDFQAGRLGQIAR